MNEQAATALAKANEIRLARARLKREICAGDPQLADVIDPHAPLEDREEIEYAIANMPLEALVTAASRVGRARFAKLWAEFTRQPYPKHGLRVKHLGPARRAQFAAYLRIKGIGKVAA